MIRKHSATLHGHRTSFSLEDEFWTELKAIAASRSVPLAEVLTSYIDDVLRHRRDEATVVGPPTEATSVIPVLRDDYVPRDADDDDERDDD